MALAVVAAFASSAGAEERAPLTVAQGGQRCAPIAGGTRALAEADAQLRIDFIRNGLRQGAHRARIWAWTWAGVYSTLTLGNYVIGATASDRDGQINGYVGAAASFVGVAVLGILPLKVMGDQRRLERRLRQARPDEDRCALVADAERWLLRDAGSEAFGSGPLVHSGNLVFNAALGVLLGAFLHQWTNGMITAATGALIGEIQIISQPTDVVRTLARYRRGDLSSGPERIPPAWLVAPIASRDQYGLQLTVKF